MKKFLPTLLALVVVITLLLSKSFTPPAQAKTVRLFVIGNSFSQNATRYLPEIAKAGGHELIMGKAEAPSRSLEMHWQAVEAADKNPADPAGKIYNGKSLRELLSTGTWDIVTIQQGSWPSGDVNSYRPYARKLYDFIKTLQPQAEVVMHQTWAYRRDAKQFTAMGPNKIAANAKEMWESSRAAYRTIAGELGVRLLPVGDAFWKVDSDSQWGFKPDIKFDAATAVKPNLPDQTNSLHAGYHWNGDNKLELDPRHASDAGCYLAGLVWYGALFGESPEKVTFVPANVPAPFAVHLRQVATQVIQEQKAVK